ncbi:MAG: Vms1/Ankzf1 family peptidyl-tRNA hydrolase [Chloroflexi bacterium]|nr:Vms1/Ankzf1 family peptidyl-tRNA hydrolase [Chloroflexota bacterium]
MSTVTGVKGPNFVHRSELMEMLIALEIEQGASFFVEMRPPGTSLPESWNWLPKTAQQSENGIVLVTETIPSAPARPRIALLPPFPLVAESESNVFDDLRRFVSTPRTVGIILLRLGHYAIGIAEDGKLIMTKSGTRFVKNQHRKGGQSSNRFRRGREKWIRELFDKVGEEANEKFGEYPGQIDHLALGGDRVVLGHFLKRITLVDGLADRALPNRLPVEQLGRKALDSAVLDTWSFRAYEPEFEE